MKAQTTSIIEAAYAVDRPTPEWLQSLVDACGHVADRGHGLWAALYDASKRTAISFGAIAGYRVDDETLGFLKMATESMPTDVIERTFVKRTCGSLSQLLGKPFLSNPLVQHAKEHWGASDCIGINAQDPTMQGCVIAVPLSEPKAVTSTFAQRWSRLAAHVASGFRLRRQLDATLERGLDGAEAVIEVDGAIAHAAGAAKELAARTALRSSAVALEKARAKAVRSPSGDVAVEAWRPLIDAQWTLYDTFDRDGRRFYLARRNAPALADDGLTQRERQVVAFAALGHSNKLIAYELGLSVSTVASHLSSAGRKLGTTSRVALIRTVRSVIADA